MRAEQGRRRARRSRCLRHAAPRACPSARVLYPAARQLVQTSRSVPLAECVRARVPRRADPTLGRSPPALLTRGARLGAPWTLITRRYTEAAPPSDLAQRRVRRARGKAPALSLSQRQAAPSAEPRGLHRAHVDRQTDYLIESRTSTPDAGVRAAGGRRAGRWIRKRCVHAPQAHARLSARR